MKTRFPTIFTEKAKAQAALLILLPPIAANSKTLSADQPANPVTFHLNFDSLAFLDDDYSNQFAALPFEQRNLKLVEGRFGKALHNDNPFVQNEFEESYMSVRDLDALLEVVAHHRFKYWTKPWRVGHMQPYVWGTGRIKTDAGSVAFWANAKRVHPGELFVQSSSSFGRLEKYLIGINLNEDDSLEAYLVDARYQRCAVRTESIWTADQFHHVALVWDRAYGFTLYVNGKPVASNWGETAWWTTQIPGLFHFPMCGTVVDELWTFDRPLTENEIQRLMTTNQPPADSETVPPLDPKAIARLKKTLVGDGIANLPSASATGERIRCREVFPTWAGDGVVNASAVIDGRLEMAWPMGYTSFTNILGDSDYQPHQVDFHLPEGNDANYVHMVGRLTDARILSGTQAATTGPGNGLAHEIASVPDDGRFLHVQNIEPGKWDRFRVPFLKGFGSPPGYAPGLHLALTNDTRIHEVSFSHVDHIPAEAKSDDSVQHFSIVGPTTIPKDERYGYAFQTLNAYRDMTVLACEPSTNVPAGTVKIQPFEKIHLLTPPMGRDQAIRMVDLDLHLKGVSEGDLAWLQLRDPGVPARVWYEVAIDVGGLNPTEDVLRLRLDPVDLRVTADDRVWIDVTFTGPVELLTGPSTESAMILHTATLAEGDSQYARKALQPALASYAKIYPWYYPWVGTQRRPDPMRPVTFGGYYDIAAYPQIVTRTDPDDFLSNVLINLCVLDAKPAAGFTFPSWETEPSFWPAMGVKKADDAPDWAFYLHHYLKGYEKIVHWWADRQHADGQVGGGWNDDVLFVSRLPGPFLYTGDAPARRMFDRVFEGLERTGMFRDGYCRIVPIDQMHAKDLVRNRYEGLLFDPGEPKKMKIAMRTAWRFGKPGDTPVNYGEAESFRYDHDLVRWYWGQGPAGKVYSTTREAVTTFAKTYAPAINDVLHFRYTDSGMFIDGFRIPGGAEAKRILVGGECGPLLEDLTLSATWEQGGGPEIPKWIEYASDTKFTAHLYSYAPTEKDVSVRLTRLRKGNYRVTLSRVGQDGKVQTVLSRQMALRRFSTVTVPVRPGREYALTIEMESALPDHGPLPDLAVTAKRLPDGSIEAEVLNFGSRPAGAFTVRAEDADGGVIGQETVGGLASAADFVPKSARLRFQLPTRAKGPLRITADPTNTVEEIHEGNNSTIASMTHSSE